VAYIPWRDFLGLTGTVAWGSSGDGVLILKMLLREIGFDRVGSGPHYNLETQTAVQTIQGKYGLSVDGVVGSLTKIALYREARPEEIPTIVAQTRHQERP
jgi:peptidoglycan hydrolase-like protein with peptidoglycan-binding domain